jgi:hypothetical protein
VTLLGESERVGRDLTKEFYLRYADMRQDAFEQLCRDNPDVSRHEMLSATQKLLDRVLFCAFCEDRGLLPVDTIQKAYEHRDPYHPRPIWENFRGLFAPSTKATRGWASTPTTAGCSPRIRCWTGCEWPTPSAATSAIWAATTTARPRKPPRPAPGPV